MRMPSVQEAKLSKIKAILVDPVKFSAAVQVADKLEDDGDAVSRQALQAIDHFYQYMQIIDRKTK